MNTSPAQASEFPEVLVEAALSTQRPVNTDIRITNLDAQIKHLSLDKLDNSTQIGLQGQRKDDGNGKGKEEMMIFDENALDDQDELWSSIASSMDHLATAVESIVTSIEGMKQTQLDAACILTEMLSLVGNDGNNSRPQSTILSTMQRMDPIPQRGTKKAVDDPSKSIDQPEIDIHSPIQVKMRSEKRKRIPSGKSGLQTNERKGLKKARK